MLISIITPCLNSERTIRQTIESVLHQTYKNIEYIIIDGGSADGTVEIIEEYRSQFHGSMRYVSEPDHGIYDAMNKGIALATGDVIGILNSDDWYEPDVLKEVRKCFQDPHTEVIYGNLNLIDKNGQVKILMPSDIEKLRYEMEIPHPTVFIRKEVYEKYGAFEKKYKIAADYELMLRLYVKGVNFIYKNIVFANFRMGGISSQKDDVVREETLIIARHYLPYVPLAERKKYREIILRRWKALYFIKMMKDFPSVFVDILTEELGVSWDDEVVIFGAGDWGRKVYKILQQRDISPSFIVDNDSKKWKKNIDGIQVYPPYSLKSFKGVLLVVVNGFSTEILQQIREMENAELDCIVWEEIVDEFMKKEFLLMEN